MPCFVLFACSMCSETNQFKAHVLLVSSFASFQLALHEVGKRAESAERSLWYSCAYFAMGVLIVLHP